MTGAESSRNQDTEMELGGQKLHLKIMSVKGKGRKQKYVKGVLHSNMDMPPPKKICTSLLGSFRAKVA